ncbi:MAG: hypothetical protein CSA34_07370 [Desulfobulbus propionicus]|nr:MAG: hypothetical protein CSA34_07370 [Desulfobulbus propionicus]
MLMESIRRLCLVGTDLAHGQVNTIRLKLPKVGTITIRNTRRIQILLKKS